MSGCLYCKLSHVSNEKVTGHQETMSPSHHKRGEQLLVQRCVNSCADYKTKADLLHAANHTAPAHEHTSWRGQASPTR